MDSATVKDLMVPLEEYATVSHNASLYDAVLALEKAQEELDKTRYHYMHRAILVYDENKRIIGKVSQLDILSALDPKYGEMGESKSMSKAGFSPDFLKNMLEQYSILTGSFGEVCHQASNVKVKNIMYSPSAGEYVDEKATVREAIHQFVMGHHQSLLVTSGNKIIGILRLTDVFKEIFHTMKTCNLP